MREIKFRAWDKKHKQMVNLDTPTAFCESGYDEIDYIAFSEGDAHYVDSSQVVWVEQYELMQYTGLKDKNGVEIYEGDIFNCMYHGDGHTDHVYTVEYYEQGTKFLLRRYGNKCPQNGVVQTVSDVARYGVIGNILENPELLEANQ